MDRESTIEKLPISIEVYQNINLYIGESLSVRMYTCLRACVRARVRVYLCAHLITHIYSGKIMTVISHQTYSYILT